MSFHIVCDSACDLEPEVIKKYDISVVPTVTIFGKESYRQGEMAMDVFLSRLEKGDFAKTSQPIPGDFMKVYDEVKDKPVLSIHITSKLSGTFSTANMVAQDYENVTTYDTLSVSIGAGYFVTLAAYLRDKGLSMNQTIEILDKAKNLVHMEVMIDDINYLKRGGRINLAKYAILGLFNLKPLIHVVDGLLKVAGIGISRLGSIKKISKRIKNRVDKINKYFILGWSTVKEDIDIIKEIVPEITENNSQTVQIGTTLLAHTGPKAAGILIAPLFESYI